MIELRAGHKSWDRTASLDLSVVSKKNIEFKLPDDIPREGIPSLS